MIQYRTSGPAARLASPTRAGRGTGFGRRVSTSRSNLRPRWLSPSCAGRRSTTKRRRETGARGAGGRGARKRGSTVLINGNEAGRGGRWFRRRVDRVSASFSRTRML